MSDWQPIETFFKRLDKTGEVQLYVPGIGVLSGRVEFVGGYVWKAGDHVFTTGDLPKTSVPGPTHWMPLPAPPVPA